MKTKKSIASYIVGIVFGFIFSIPWLLCYTFLKLSSSYLSVLIVIGIIGGYKLVNKEIYNNKKTKLYLALTSIFITMINIWLFMPIIIILNYDNSISLLSIYSYTNVIIGLLIDTFVAVIMVLISSLLLPIDFKKAKNKKSESKEFITLVEDVFKKYDALSRDKAHDKTIIREDLKNINYSNIKKVFYTDILKGIAIKSYKGKLYYKKHKKDIKIGALITLCIVIIFAALCNIIFSLTNISEKLNISENNYKIKTNNKSDTRVFNIDDKIILDMPDCMKFYKKNYDENQNRYYYQYLSRNVSKSNIEVVEIYYYDEFNTEIINDTFYENIKKNLDKYNIMEEESKSLNNMSVKYFKLENLDNTRYVNAYYTQSDNKLFEIYVYLNKRKYTKDDNNKSDKIIESLKMYDKNSN